MEEGSGVCLNIGSGRIKWPGWIGVDLDPHADIQADIKSLPFADDYADYLAAIHVIEHFYKWEALDVLKEWRRVLKPGGTIILELPCMDKVFYYIQQCMNQGLWMSPTFSTFPLWGDPKYENVAMCHKWGYMARDMISLLQDAGFQNVQVMKPNYHFPDRDMRLEAVKC